jgi:cyclophilin family peptidyl-prolyl cis-trans isomerase
MARRRLRPEPGSGATLPLDPPAVSPRTAVIALVAFFIVLGGIGVLIQRAVYATPGGNVTSCRTSAQITPRRFAEAQPMCIDASRTYTATIVTTKGNLVVRLDAKGAPQTVNNFVVLAVNHYYDGMRFWRIQDWIAQTGDPYGSGTWTPGYYLPQEGAVDPGWATDDLGMARPPSGFVNGAQFFMLKLPWPSPGPQAVYNRFGHVVSGDPALQSIDANDHIIDIQVSVR